MACFVESGRWVSLLVASSVAMFVACGGGSGGGGDPATDGGSASGGGTDSGPSGGTTDARWPQQLPQNEADCAAAPKAEACYTSGCCTELLACSKNDACAAAYDCYVGCGPDDASCLAECFGPSVQDGAEDFSAALTCLTLRTPSCGGSVNGGGDGGSGAGGEPNSNAGPLGSARDSLGWDLNVSDDPLVAELKADTDRAVSKVVTVEGDTLSAKAADGTTFELVIPAGALYGPTLITMTPLASLSVPSLEGEAHGVRLEPDGLQFMGTPTLRVTPPKGEKWPIDRQLPLSITGTAQAVSLALFDPKSETLELSLSHFSSYGALLTTKGVGATLSEGEIRSRFAGDVEERLRSATAERLSQERQRELLGAAEDSSSIAELVDKLFPEYEKNVVKPRIAKAGESCAAGKLAFQTVLGFERQKQLLGVSDDPAGFIDLLPVVAEVCLKEEYELCRDNHIITRVLPVLFSYWRQAQLLGLGTEVGGVTIAPPWVQKAEAYANKCLKFELRFDSDVLYSDTAPDTSMNETVTSTVPVKLNGSFTTIPTEVLPPAAQENGALIFGGPAPLKSTRYAVHTNERCRTIDGEHRADGEMYVGFMSFTPGITTEDTPGGSPEVLDFSLSLAFSPNTSNYDFTVQREEEAGCREVIASGNDVLSWSSSLGAYMLEKFSTGSDGALVDVWEIQHGGGQILAVKDLSLNGADASATYRGPVNMVLLHTPDP
jgi:hypothetical protein